MEVSGRHQSPAAQPLGKEPTVTRGTHSQPRYFRDQIPFCCRKSDDHDDSSSNVNFQPSVRFPGSHNNSRNMPVNSYHTTHIDLQTYICGPMKEAEYLQTNNTKVSGVGTLRGLNAA